MKKISYLITLGLAIVIGLASCEEKPEQPVDSVDLRYRVADSYDLDAISPKPFTIVVKSTKPWTIKSYHPEWCIIELEEGEAVADSLVHVGQGESTSVRVQYYDNDQLDDRIDYIEIESGGWVGKKVTIYQKGIAYLNVPESDIDEGLMFEKAGGEAEIHVNSNQPWSAKVIEGSWLSISEGATGQLDGVVKLSAKENTGEKRYAAVAVYDRNGEERAVVKFTQDGVQLDPETFEIRAGYDQLSATLSVVSNTKWEAEKGGETDWFEIENPSGHDGDGVITLKFTDNSAGTSLRKSSIVLKTIKVNDDDAVATKEIAVKQAYPIAPVRHMFDSDELSLWHSDKGVDPVYNKGVGTLFTGKTDSEYSRVNQGDMPFGNYTFRWSNMEGAARVRHWFCYSESAELKLDVRPANNKISFSFNAPGGEDAQKPAVSSEYTTGLDFSQPMEITFKFDPSGADYCHVTYLCNGVEMISFDTSENTMRSTKWGSKINMYLGVSADGNPGSAVLEWYEYTPPMNWDE
ncbi:MAG: BACON domain-containing protein [Bacteroidales bacterium]|nr:BACON domain-containing protein [Bacteroidales bacterium]